MQNYLEVIEILLIFAASEMTIRVTFPREGKALSILPHLKVTFGWLLFFISFSKYTHSSSAIPLHEVSAAISSEPSFSNGSNSNISSSMIVGFILSAKLQIKLGINKSFAKKLRKFAISKVMRHKNVEMLTVCRKSETPSQQVSKESG